MKSVFLLIFILLFASNLLSKEIVVAIADWAPYEYFDKSGKSAGLNVEIVQGAAKSIGMKVKFELYPWTRCLMYVKSGKVDAILSLNKTKSREKFLYFVPAVISEELNVLFVKNNSEHGFDGDLKKLSGKTVVVARNNLYGKAFDNASYIVKYNANNSKVIIRMISHGRANYGISSKYPLIYISTEIGLRNEIKILDPPVSYGKLYLGFTKRKGTKYKLLANKLGKAIKKFKKTKEYRKILKKYDN